tara:strand:- start:4060 stop:5250 length:1191 start_codon:yes stop_codon:yes gene_type:complete
LQSIEIQLTMSELENSIESIVKSMGVNIVDNLDHLTQGETVTDNTEESVESSTSEDSEQPEVEAVTEEPQTEEVQEETPTADTEPEVYRYEQKSLEETQSEESEDYNEEDVQSLVNDYLSKTLGLTLEDISSRINTPADIDERIAPILQFVNDTGRSPEDWFRYQSLNPSEMDDLTVIKMQMMVDYPELTVDDVSMLVSNKYKTDADLYDENEVKMAQLQMKIDSGKARKDIQGVRDSYLMPVETTPQQVQSEPESIIDEKWVQSMSMDVDSLDAIDFDLSGGKVFSYGINDRYRENLKNKNAKLDEYFDQYVDNQGRWDFEKLSMHRTVVDNIDEIVKAIYQQGLGDGQRKVVESAANIQTKTPELGNVVDGKDKIAEQVRNIMGRNDDMMRFNL